MQINSTMIASKAKLISKELGKLLPVEKRMGSFSNVVSYDTVSLFNKKGIKFTINTYKDAQGRVLYKYFAPQGASRYILRGYTYGEANVVNQNIKHPYTQIETSVRNAQHQPISNRKEILSVNIAEDGKKAVTKSKNGLFGINDKYAQVEDSGVAFYQNKKPANFYYTYTQRNNNNDIIQQYVTHSKDNIPEEIYKNEYLPMLHFKGVNFATRIFDHIIKRNELHAENIAIKSAKLGYTPGQPTQYAYFDKLLKKFAFNIDSPHLTSKSFFINATEHELKHAQQVKEIELLNQGKLTGKRLEKAKIYEQELDNYIHFSVDQTKYYGQLVEKEAHNIGYSKQNACSKMIDLLQNKFKDGKLLENQLGYNYTI